MKIAIIGGGIGGMTLALSLHDAGFRDVDIYESDARVTQLGVGINVLPHAVRELSELGLEDQLAAVAIPTAEIAFYSSRGQRIWGEPRGLAAGYRWPQFSIHRGELLMILYRAVVERLGHGENTCVHTGHHLASFGSTTDGSRAWAQFVDRGTGAALTRIEADVLVGCDGVHSVVRQALYPNEGPPKWNGVTMWRGITRGKPFLSGRTMIMAGHFARRVVVYPISRQMEERGEALLNWVSELKVSEDRPMPRQDWQHKATADDAVRPFETYQFDFLNVPAMIRSAEAVYQYPMVDRDPLPTWNAFQLAAGVSEIAPGPITLLGDAAHPMYPVGSNGASQAILDARVLARDLATHPTVVDALTAYDAERRPATAAVVAANRKVGPEQCMEIVEARAPDGFTDLADIISTAELEEISRAYKLTAGFDPPTLNARPSYSVKTGRS